MWQRFELKERAKQVLRNCFWPAVAVCLISGLLAGEFAGERSSGIGSSNSSGSYTISEMRQDLQNGGVRIAEKLGTNVAGFLTAGLAPLVIYFGFVIFAIAILINIFIGFPILVGSKRFFMSSREQRTGIGELFFAYSSGRVLNVVFVQFIQGLKTFLWTLLFIIPGIVKGYEYMMIPYILAENPAIDQKRAFALSRDMMEGQKWEAFVLDLTFIFWNILAAFTCGLLNIFYVHPYKAATRAELYAVLREDLLRRGGSNTYELPGFRAPDII